MSETPGRRLLGLVADLFQVLALLAALGLGVVAYAGKREEEGLDAPTLGALVAVLLTGLILAGLGLRSRYASGAAFRADRGRYATISLHAGLLMTTASLALFAFLL